MVTILHEHFTASELDEIATKQIKKTIQFKNGHKIIVEGCALDKIWIQFYHTKRAPKCYYFNKRQIQVGLVSI